MLKMSRDYSQVASDEAINTAAKSLETNGFKVEIVNNLDEAKTAVLGMIPEGSDVFTGASETLRLTGLTEELNESGKYDPVRAKFANTKDELERRRLGSASDYAVGSVHAVTEDGQVVIASYSGSQLPNYVYGANHFIWVAGAQKIVKDLNEALERIETHTLLLETGRMQAAHGIDSVIAKILIYRKEPAGRGTIVLIKEAVGY